MFDIEICKDHLKRAYNKENGFDMSKKDFEQLVSTFGRKMLEEARRELNLPPFASKFCNEEN